MILTKDQEKKVIAAGQLLKEAMPNEDLQFCFNLSRKHSNTNYNIKQSGIIPAKRVSG